MYDLFRKVISAGLEIQDKVVDSLDELVKKGKINEKDREKFLKDLDKKIEETKDKGEEFTNEIIDKLSIKNPFAARKEFEDLQEKVKQLEKKLHKLEGKKPTAGKKTTAKKDEPKKSGPTKAGDPE